MPVAEKEIINQNNKIEKTGNNKWVILVWVFAFGGLFGFVYEELFYYIDLGRWIKRGSTFGPWVPIYGFGAVTIVVLTYKLKKNPLAVLFVSILICGTLEYITGWVLFNVWNVRLWDYNVEIWNWFNIGGFICLRSVLFFGVSAMFLQYVIIPIFEKLEGLCKNKKIRVLTVIPSVVFAADIIVYNFLK